MGLDSYMNRMPRYKATTAAEVSAVEDYFSWLNRPDDYGHCTLEGWCGVREDELPGKDVIEYYRQFYDKKYSAWDEEKKYGHDGFFEQVGYWRKANAIHQWFVENVQDGEDDCRYHHECTKEILEDLLDICKTVLESCVMTYGKVKVGERYSQEEGWVTDYDLGKVLIDKSVAERLLPTQGGFFFGSTDYNEYYVNDVQETIKILEKVLNETDFETQAIYYVSSW